MVDTDEGNLGAKIFFIWGSLCTLCFLYAYLLIFETKGLTLEQVDKMMEESTPTLSAKWKPHSTFAADMGFATDKAEVHEEAEVKV
jgi:Sugar (and other) transporter